MTRKKVLLVEDNKKIMAGNVRKFTRSGYEVDCAFTLAQAREALANNPDIIILDIMMPDGSGLDFMQEVRQSDKAATPILLLTGLSAQEDILHGLRSGGDEYLTKPYDFAEMMARVEILLRLSSRIPEVLHVGRLSIDITAGVAMYDGKDLLLAKKEYALLLIFIQNVERYIKAEYLCEKVWNSPLENNSAALKSAIKRLRAKIENCGWSIGWSRGEGYIFEKV